jgi:hypothetical protein
VDVPRERLPRDKKEDSRGGVLAECSPGTKERQSIVSTRRGWDVPDSQLEQRASTRSRRSAHEYVVGGVVHSVEDLRLNRIKDGRLCDVEFSKDGLAEALHRCEEREVEEREVGWWLGWHDDLVQRDEVGVLCSHPAIRDDSGVQSSRQDRRDGDDELLMDSRRRWANEDAGELKYRQVVLVFYPDPERLDGTMLLLRPLELSSKMEANANEVVRDGLEVVRDGEGGHLSSCASRESSQSFVLVDEGSELGIRHHSNLVGRHVVRPALEVVHEVGGEVELTERIAERPHSLCTMHQQTSTSAGEGQNQTYSRSPCSWR